MTILFLIYLLFILIWFGGIAVGIFHVLKYRIPGDVTMVALWIFICASALAFLVSVYIVSGISWGA